MPTTIRLTPMSDETAFAPLGVLGYCLTRTAFLTPLWQGLDLPLKTVDYAPSAKLLDLVVSILAGCRAIVQVNTRLRPDVALAHAWGRERFAEQATLARTLNAFAESHVVQLRQGSEALFRRESQVFRHDFAQDWLWLDIDLTPLPISKRAEASTKGKFAKKTTTAANWHACMRRNTTRPCSPTSIRASKIVDPRTFRCLKPWSPV